MKLNLSFSYVSSETTNSIKEFLELYCTSEIAKILQSSDLQKHYSLQIDASSLFELNEELLMKLVLEPEQYINLFEDAVRLYEDQLLSSFSEDARIYGHTFKECVHVRPFHLPQDPLLYKKNVSSLRSSDIGHLISFRGTVIRTGSVLMRETQRTYQCTKCKHRFIVHSDITRGGRFELPTICPSASLEEPCRSTAFQLLDDTRSTDYQEIKIQERVQSLDLGSVPRSIVAALSDDLVDICKPGDDVLITGILKRLWYRNPCINLRCEVDLMLDTTHVQVINEQKSQMEISEEAKRRFIRYWQNAYAQQRALSARDVIVESFCPRLCGLKTIKLILLTALIGGVCRPNREGDPGTGKSQLLQEAASLSPRSISTTGTGSTHAGLTVTAVREASSGEWALESGALVLADGGLCCIDEFDGIKDHDRAAMHEVMEQQTLSVAKAGLVMTLDTRTTIFAAVNPKIGRVHSKDEMECETGDQATELALSVGIAPPLLSRFDVAVTLLDKHDPVWDEKLSDFILNDYKLLDNEDWKPESKHSDFSHYWSVEEMQMYIYFVKESSHPELTCSAQRIVSKYYTMQRQVTSRNAARTTVRFLESLIRLAQAHARLLFRKLAVVQDAIYAIFVTESSAFGNNVLQLERDLQTGETFENSDSWYQKYAKAVLERMELGDSIDPNEYLSDTKQLLLFEFLEDYSKGFFSQEEQGTQNVIAARRENYRRVSFSSLCTSDKLLLNGDLDDSPSRTEISNALTPRNKRPKTETELDTREEICHSTVLEESNVNRDNIVHSSSAETHNTSVSGELAAWNALEELDENELDSALLGSWIEPKNPP
eukprot:jgi/Galph1/819/GphlegSOOS_G5461.1